MRVIEQYVDLVTGESGQREVELPGVITAEEAAAREAAEAPERERQRRIEELRTDMAATLVDQALGLDVTARLQQLCDAFKALR